MIYVVEFPHQARPSAWFAFDQDDFVRKVRVRWTGDLILFAAASPRQMLEAVGLNTDSAGARGAHPSIFDLAEAHGWDSRLYRADYLLGHGVYQVEPVSEFEAYVAAIAHDLHTCRIYPTDEAATNALYGDPLYDGREGLYAHVALRDQLVALEVISDDL